MSNTIPEFQQTKITIGDQEYEGYKSSAGYFMNLSQVARILNKGRESVSETFNSKGFKTLLGKALTVSETSGLNSRPVKLIDTGAVSDYILYWVTKADPLAIKIMAELSRQNLDIRIENALGPIEPEKVAELTEQLNGIKVE